MKNMLMLLTIFFASNAIAEDLRLSCIVNGKSITTFFGKVDKKESVDIKNEKVDVIVSSANSNMLIKVEGGSRALSKIVSTYPMKNTNGKDKIIENYSDGNIFHIKNSFLDVQEMPVEINTDIKIDRVLGKITVKAKLDTIGMADITTNYSGNCSKVNNVNKF